MASDPLQTSDPLARMIVARNEAERNNTPGIPLNSMTEAEFVERYSGTAAKSQTADPPISRDDAERWLPYAESAAKAKRAVAQNRKRSSQRRNRAADTADAFVSRLRRIITNAK